MTAYERLRLEVDGITGIITKYTSDRGVHNMTEQLRVAVGEKNKENILYCLNQLKTWYELSMNSIMSNDFVGTSGRQAHSRNVSLISSLIEGVNSENPDEWVNKEKNIIDSSKPVIFLSHCSVDKKYGDALRNYIVGLGVPNTSLVYTSHPLHKIPLDQNIYEYLRKQIVGNVFVIILWSNSYLNSPACLNEMGAAWVAQKDYTNIYVPDFDFGNPKYHQCAVDTRKMGAVLNGNDNCRISMVEFKQKIANLFNLEIDEKQAQFLLDMFIKEISEDI